MMRINSKPVRLKSNKDRKLRASAKIKRYVSLDRIVSNDYNGEYTAPLRRNAVRYNVRKIDNFCRVNGIKPENLTREQLKNFILS